MVTSHFPPGSVTWLPAGPSSLVLRSGRKEGWGHCTSIWTTEGTLSEVDLVKLTMLP